MVNTLTFIKAFFSGIFIGAGGVLYLIIIRYTDCKELASIAFSIGLFSVCILHFPLYTGAVGFVKNYDDLLNLIIMYPCNMAGALGLGYMFRGLIFDYFANIEQYKEPPEVKNCWRTVILSMLCGACVYNAVKEYNIFRTHILVFYVFMFVYGGFEHCVANMFYWSFYNEWGHKWSRALLNIFIATVGNSIGALLNRDCILLKKLHNWIWY